MASDRYTQSKTSNTITTTKFTMSVTQSTLTSTPYNYQTSRSTIRVTQSTRTPTLKNDNTTGSTIPLVFGVVSTVLFVATITILGYTSIDEESLQIVGVGNHNQLQITLNNLR